MSRAKETRRQIIESGSPLRSHSLNQRKLKNSDEGQVKIIRRKSRQKSSEINEETTENQDQLIQKLLRANLPLSQNFLQTMLPSMITIATRRIAEEEEKGSPIPIRIFRIVTDIQRIYRTAKEKGIHLQMLDQNTQPNQNSEDKNYFPQYLQHTKYPALFSSINYINMINKRLERTTNNQEYADFYKALRLNLTSCDFSLPTPDQVLDRVRFIHT